MYCNIHGLENLLIIYLNSFQNVLFIGVFCVWERSTLHKKCKTTIYKHFKLFDWLCSISESERQGEITIRYKYCTSLYIVSWSFIYSHVFSNVINTVKQLGWKLNTLIKYSFLILWQCSRAEAYQNGWF